MSDGPGAQHPGLPVEIAERVAWIDARLRQLDGWMQQAGGERQTLLEERRRLTATPPPPAEAPPVWRPPTGGRQAPGAGPSAGPHAGPRWGGGGVPTAGPAPQWGAPPPQRPVDEERVGEWRAAGLRDVLLWTGGALLVLAAAIAVGLAWDRAQEVGRAAMLVAATAGAIWAGMGLRDRLPATAATFAGVGLALVVVDFAAVRRTGYVDEIDALAWWSAAVAMTSAIAFALGRWFVFARFVAVAAGHLSILLLAAHFVDDAFVFALAGVGLSGVSLGAAEILSRRTDDWAGTAVAWDFAAAAWWLVGAGGTIALIPDAEGVEGLAFTTALAVAALAVPPACVVLFRTRSHSAAEATDPLMTTATFVLLALAVPTLLLGEASVGAHLTVAGGLAGILLVLSHFLPGVWRQGSRVAALPFAVPAAVGIVAVVAQVVLSPWSTVALWADDLSRPVTDLTLEVTPWVWAWVAVLVFDQVAFGWRSEGEFRDMLGRHLTESSFAGVVAVLLLAPSAIGIPVAGAIAVGTVCVVVGMAGAILAPRERKVSLPAVAMWLSAVVVFAAAVGGLSLASRPATLFALTVALVVGAAGAWWLTDVSIRLVSAAVAAVAWCGVAVTAAAPHGLAVTGVSLTIAAAVGLVATAWLADTLDARAEPMLGVIMVSAGVTGLACASVDPDTLAVALTVATVGVAGAALAPGHGILTWAVSVLAVATAWAWMWSLGVDLLEAYTLLAAGVVTAGGWWVRNRVDTRSRPGSWTAYGAAVALALLPTLAVAVGQGDELRAVLAAVGGLAALLIGWQFRLQAPIVIGGLVVLTVAVDAVGPSIVALPLWLTIGIAGAVIVWLGATAEKQLARVRKARARFDELE